jgi:hypothetical protein
VNKVGVKGIFISFCIHCAMLFSATCPSPADARFVPTRGNNTDLFHDFPANEFENFINVNGQRKYGLIIDPDASKGLIGLNSLRELITHVIRPNKQFSNISWAESAAKFSGISSKSEESIGRVSIPIGLVGCPPAAFIADVIQGSGSQCPGLMPLHTFVSNGCILACGCFSNKDGLLLIKLADNHYAPQRVLFTDSGHYLLEIHRYTCQHPTSEHSAKVKNITMHVSTALKKFPSTKQFPVFR